MNLYRQSQLNYQDEMTFKNLEQMRDRAMECMLFKDVTVKAYLDHAFIFPLKRLVK